MHASPERGTTKASTIQIQPVENMNFDRDQDREVSAQGL